MGYTVTDRRILRDLAQRVADIDVDPEMLNRPRRWIEHNTLRSTYPMMLVFPEGAWSELLPGSALACQAERARGVEWELRRRIHQHEHFRDDAVIEAQWSVPRAVTSTGWGLEAQWIPSPAARGARRFAPVLKSAADLGKLRQPRIACDEDASRRAHEEMQDLFGDILAVTLDGVKHISYHLMAQYTGLRGLEEAMLDMCMEPGMVHDAMAFFEEGHRNALKQYVEQDLLELNNDNTYHSSGGNGFTDELPLPDFDAARVRPRDMWASAEAQEMAQVGPEHHAEFVLPYEKRLLEAFGLTGYGCCEDLTLKLDWVFTIPGIRRISISPWADVDVCAERMHGDYILSWKPNPAHLVGDFDPERVRGYVRHAVRAASRHDCVLEIILKDTHTCQHHPERFDEWTQVAREVILEEAGAAPGYE